MADVNVSVTVDRTLITVAIVRPHIQEPSEGSTDIFSDLRGLRNE
jgi:hypothetical protein